MKVFVTGALGLVGSNVTDLLCAWGNHVIGIDSDARREFFGPDGSTSANAAALRAKHGLNFLHVMVDVRNEWAIEWMFKDVRPDAVVHCAGQPSHDWATDHPLEDFDVNARATVGLLEACRRHCPEAPFVFMSTNKFYGVDLAPVAELYRRWEFVDLPHGIDEDFPIARSSTSLYGAGKLAADAYVQEYGRYHGMPTTCLRAGCITGAGHAAVQAHGFLSYLVRCNVEGRRYVVKGHKGKQVRDNIHAADLAELIVRIIDAPGTPGQVFNVGGGGHNSCSILEAFKEVEALTGKPTNWTYDPEARRGDQVCYYTDLRKVMAAYPGWGIKRDLLTILGELVDDWRGRGPS